MLIKSLLQYWQNIEPQYFCSYLSFHSINFSCQSLDHPVQVSDLCFGRPQVISISVSRCLHLLILHKNQNNMRYWASSIQSVFPKDYFEINTIPNHLSLVPSLSFSTCSVGNVFILSPDFSNNSIHVKITTVVHLNNDRCIFDLALKLTQFLKNKKNIFFYSIIYSYSLVYWKKKITGIVIEKCYLKKYKVFIRREDKTISLNWFRDIPPHRLIWGSWFHLSDSQAWLPTQPYSCRPHLHPGNDISIIFST